MKTILVTVLDKNDLQEFERIGRVVFVSSIMSVVGLQMNKDDVYKLNEIDNVLSYREEGKAQLQDMPACV